MRILRNQKLLHSHSHGGDLSSADDKKKVKRRKGSHASKEKKSDISSAEEVDALTIVSSNTLFH